MSIALKILSGVNLMATFLSFLCVFFDISSAILVFLTFLYQVFLSASCQKYRDFVWTYSRVCSINSISSDTAQPSLSPFCSPSGPRVSLVVSRGCVTGLCVTECGESEVCSLLRHDCFALYGLHGNA